MGMAASQARYLGLTARKTNVEYEGQQVNQQRTALANQSAGLFNQLMSLQVPVPPDTTEYTKVQYAYNDGYNVETITNMLPLVNDPDYNYTVTHYHNEEVYKGISKVKTDPNVTLTTGTYRIDGNIATLYDASTDADAVAKIKADKAGTNFANAPLSEVYSYKLGGQKFYTCLADLETSRTSGSTPQSPLNTYYAASVTEKIETTEKAQVDKNESGRFTNITTESTPDTDFQLSTETTTDEIGYQDAMNQYNYNVAKYEKEVEDINAKTRIIQEEDRTLELRLKQLDTEQEALQTEMDAVKKVIDKNIETTFKTFA